MQDVLSLLSKFIPPERILKLCFSSGFRFYVYKIPHICKMRRLFWSNYTDIIEGVNLEYCWELIPYIPEYEYARLKPKGDFDKFIFYIGPYYGDVHINFIVIWAIILEDLEVIKKLANLNVLEKSYNYYIGAFPVYVKYSKILHPAVQILQDSKSNIVDFFTGLKQFCTGGNVWSLSYMIDPGENQPVSALIRHWGPDVWRNIMYLLRYCGEIGRDKIREIMHGCQHYNVRIFDKELVVLTREEIEFLRQFRKKWTREVYFKMTCLVIPQKNLHSYIRKNAGLIKIYIKNVCIWDYTGYYTRPSKKQKIKMIKIMVKNRDFCRQFIRVIKTPFTNDTLLKLKYYTNSRKVLYMYGFRLLDDSSIEAIVSLSSKIELSDYIPPKLWKFLKDLTPFLDQIYPTLHKFSFRNLKNAKKYSNQFESLKPFIKNMLEYIKKNDVRLYLKRSWYKIAQLYGMCID